MTEPSLLKSPKQSAYSHDPSEIKALGSKLIACGSVHPRHELYSQLPSSTLAVGSKLHAPSSVHPSIAITSSSSIIKLQSLSIPDHVPSAPGYIDASLSLQSSPLKTAEYCRLGSQPLTGKFMSP